MVAKQNKTKQKHSKIQNVKKRPAVVFFLNKVVFLTYSKMRFHKEQQIKCYCCEHKYEP